MTRLREPLKSDVVLLDRDGVVNEERADFVRCVDDWVPIPGSLAAIARLHRAGRRVAIVTNQSGVGRGLLTDSALAAIHARLAAAVEAEGGAIAGFFHCPHVPEDACACRKPRTGLIEAAARTLGFDPRGTPLVGDRASDLAAARAVGGRPILVRSGRTPHDLADSVAGDAPVFDDLAAWVAAELGPGRFVSGG